MGMVLNTNIGAIQAQRALTESRKDMEKAMERLSTGKRINGAADDAAGLAMVERMNTQIRGLTMATKNANDGISLIRTVENALVEVSGMLQRMRVLAVQSANDTNTATERAFANNELNQLNWKYPESLSIRGIMVLKFLTALFQLNHFKLVQKAVSQ